MSRTLFWYIFRDLVRIFFLASGVLAGIMSFGGLLRPLTEHGLDAGQVVKLLGYFSPAMTTYSLPIAALFATTIVYGRLGADNEITACRAAGISHLWLALPALVLGLLVALASLFLLCFVVPIFTLKVETVIYSNLAKLVAGQIERTHQIRFDHQQKPVTVFAQAAQVLSDPARPRDQQVRLFGPMIVTYEPARSGRDTPPIPEEFYMARSATAYIRQHREEDDVTLSAQLDGGTSFPRRFGSDARQNVQISVRTQSFGPIPLPSPVKENTRFMDIFRLRATLEHPEQSRSIRRLLRDFISQQQRQEYLAELAREINGPAQAIELISQAEQYTVYRAVAPAEVSGERLVIVGERPQAPVRLVQTRQGRTVLDVQAGEVRIRPWPEVDRRRLTLDIEMLDCVVRAGADESERGNFARQCSLPMPESIAAASDRPVGFYLSASGASDDERRLRGELRRLQNSIHAELHARASFSVSCLVLVLVGCALGMMFSSGNFLSAFAVSVVPALASLALVVTGQHTCENVPARVSADWVNPLRLGLGLIWSGNAAVLLIAVVLLGRLQRQ